MSRRASAAAVWVSILLGYVVWARTQGLGPTESADRIGDVITSSFWGPLIFIGLYVLRPLVLFPASVLTILAGTVFGPVWGSVLAVLASNLSTAVTYVVGDFFGSEAVVRRGRSLLGEWLDKALERPFETTLIMRLMYFPYDLVAYMAGAVKLRYVPFAVATALGSIPGTIAFVGFGASLESVEDGTPSFDWRVFGASLALTVLGIVVSRALRRRPLR